MKKNIISSIDLELIKSLILNSSRLSEVLKKLSIQPLTKNIQALKRLLIKNKIDFSHIPLGKNSNKNIPMPKPNLPKTKKCPICKEVKLRKEDFYRFSNRKIAGYCKECSKELSSLYTKSREKTKDLMYKRKGYTRKYRYGITNEEIDLLNKKQENKCKICSKEFINEIFDIDHCHKTGKVRGLLCRKCNYGLGCFEDDVKLLKKVIDYLK